MQKTKCVPFLNIKYLTSTLFGQRKYNVPVTLALLKSGLINTALQDQQLAKVLFTDPRPTLLAYTAALIRECLSSDPPVASQNQFQYSIEVLSQLSQNGKGSEEYVGFSCYILFVSNHLLG